jgi:predicted transcriptional regulator
MGHDYTDEMDRSTDKLGELSSLAEELRGAETEVANLEAKLAAAKADVERIAEEEIPELMAEIGMAEFKTASGFTVSIDRKVYAKIPKYRMGEAVQWLDDNGEGGMVRRKVIVDFNRDQEDAAAELAEDLESKYAAVAQDYSVHSSTLKAWAKRKIEAGEELPEDLFGILTKQVAKIG